jgi:DNA-binding NtrC family response regulator
MGSEERTSRRKFAAPTRRVWRGSSGVSAQFIGHSPAFRSIIETIRIVSCRECPVIITGETGTGKEMVARQIHVHSSRSKAVFVAVDCATLTGQLFESQLFGHVKGAFTGAICDTLGFFRAANSGTIFLDEIGELSCDVQAKLLRVLEQSCVTPLGSTQSYSVDVRVLCATNHNMPEMIRQGQFRSDLYYRLNVVQIEVPPLRARREDIVTLAEYFLNQQAELYNEPRKQLTASAESLLTSYDWPGNVRELANVMERAYIMSRSSEIGPSVLSRQVLAHDIMDEQGRGFPTMAQVERKLVMRALEAADGRKMVAAKLLRIDHRRLNRLIKKHNLRQTYE